jgi:hypothetical protein
MKKLTIGMCSYDDYDGVYFTIQSIRLYHQDIIDEIEFIIVDNNPDSESGQATKEFTNSITQPIQYIPFNEYSSTSLRNLIFKHSRTPYTICMDCHVLLAPNSLKKLIHYYDAGLDNANLLQGPLLYDDYKHVSTHFNNTWGSFMEGQWETDSRYVNSESQPFEIPAQGMGLFTCRTDSWLGFNENFRGFGGEEVYIHDKYKKFGKITQCLPFLGWMHRFTRIGGTRYRNDLLDRYRNYYIGYTELGKDTTILDEVFKTVGTVQQKQQIKIEVEKLFNKFI